MFKIPQHDFGARYGGRLIVVEVFCNTDEDPNKIGKRIQRAARGIKLNAAATRIRLYEGKEALEVWNEIAKMGADIHANPNAKPFNQDED
jgi:hypothetical protein